MWKRKPERPWLSTHDKYHRLDEPPSINIDTSDLPDEEELDVIEWEETPPPFEWTPPPRQPTPLLLPPISFPRIIEEKEQEVKWNRPGAKINPPIIIEDVTQAPTQVLTPSQKIKSNPNPFNPNQLLAATHMLLHPSQYKSMGGNEMPDASQPSDSYVRSGGIMDLWSADDKDAPIRIRRRSQYRNMMIPIRYKQGTTSGIERYGATRKEATQQQKMNRYLDGFTGMGAYRRKRRRLSMRPRRRRYTRRRYRGRRRNRGGYFGRLAGGALGSIIGMPAAGAALGDKAGDWLYDKAVGATKKWLGQGAYNEVTNSLINPQPNDPAVIRMQSSQDETGTLSVVHREYVTDIAANSSFLNVSQLINPTNPNLFPYLSQFACNFEEYEFMQLIFEYRSVTTDLTTNTQQLGTVIMVCNYNPAQQQFDNKVNMMQYDGSKSCKVSSNLLFGIECDPRKLSGDGQYFVPPYGQTPIGEDPKTYHLGLFQIAVNQSSAQGQIGELWVNYNIRLRKPKFCVAIAANQPYLGAKFVGDANSMFGTPFGSTILQSTPNSPALAPSVNTNLNNQGQVTVVRVPVNPRTEKLSSGKGLNEWWFWGLDNANSYLFLPDNLAQGTYRVTLAVSGATVGQGIVLSTGGSNIQLLSSQLLFDNTGTTPYTEMTFKVNGSAVNAGIAGPTNTGSYLRYTCGGPLGATPSLFWNITSINPGIAGYI